MPFTVFKHSKISAISAVVPRTKKSIYDERHLYGNSDNYIKKLINLMGISERFVTDESTTASDLCFEAARNLFQENNSSADSVDCVMVVTQTPDYIMPFNAAVLHGRLGLKKECAAFDINHGCSGYVYALWLAFHLIELGSVDRVLVLAGDTMSKLVNPADKVCASLFGDAGTASLIERIREKSTSYFKLGADGTAHNNIMVPGGGFRHPKSEKTAELKTFQDGSQRSDEDFYMNGSAVFAFSTAMATCEVQKLMQLTGYKLSDIDYAIFHQANKYIVQNIMMELKLPPEKVPCTLTETYGNVSMASIPLTCCASLSSMLGAASQTVIMCGFGVGLSWGSCLLEMEKTKCSPVKFYRGMNHGNAE